MLYVEDGSSFQRPTTHKENVIWLCLPYASRLQVDSDRDTFAIANNATDYRNPFFHGYGNGDD